MVRLLIVLAALLLIAFVPGCPPPAPPNPPPAPGPPGPPGPPTPPGPSCGVASIRLFPQITPTAASPETRALARRARHKRVCDPTSVEVASKSSSSRKPRMRCHAHALHRDDGMPLTTDVPAGYGPRDFHAAYGLPDASARPGTIALVVAYDAPTIKDDLDMFDQAFGLLPFPTCCMGQVTGCFQKVNQDGQASPLPAPDAGWALEASMDVETAHGICPNCRILLVEARSTSIEDLGAAVNAAVALGATVVSNSYGGGDMQAVPYYDHPNVAITASAGDSGWEVEAPASFPQVVAVGGTTLDTKSDGSYLAETVWSGSGSGCSAMNLAPWWQRNAPGWKAAGCGTQRGNNDVAADADPNTGAAVYDSTPYQGQAGWFVIGGTSLSSPLVAGVFGLAGDSQGLAYPAQTLYTHGSFLHDVATGSNGACGSTICMGAPGYDGPTGMGTPSGIGGF